MFYLCDQEDGFNIWSETVPYHRLPLPTLAQLRKKNHRGETLIMYVLSWV